MPDEPGSKEPNDAFEWLLAQAERPFSGWDFSFISATGRMDTAPLPWSYASLALMEIARSRAMLDMGTGGGELLEALRPYPPVVFATEGYPPNISIARRRLEPLGVHVVKVTDDGRLPFDDGRFDLVINRHEYYDPSEVLRVLRPNGRFLTQQVGGKSYRGIPELLGMPGSEEFARWELPFAVDQIVESGFRVISRQEAFPALRFYDVGALVYYLKAVPWVLPGFSVEIHRDALRRVHQRILDDGSIDVEDHRFLIVAEKPGGDG